MPLLQHFSTPQMRTQHTPEARKHFRLKMQVLRSAATGECYGALFTKAACELGRESAWHVTSIHGASSKWVGLDETVTHIALQGEMLVEWGNP